jgi:hypothetical protein
MFLFPGGAGDAIHGQQWDGQITHLHQHSMQSCLIDEVPSQQRRAILVVADNESFEPGRLTLIKMSSNANFVDAHRVDAPLLCQEAFPSPATMCSLEV